MNRVYLPATVSRPESEMAATTENRVVLDGDRVRVEDNNPILAPGGGFARHRRIDVFDGEQDRTFFPAGIGPDTTPTGIMRAKGQPTEAAPPAPLVWHFRAFTPAFGTHKPDVWQPTGRTVAFDGVDCQEYLVQTQQRWARYWVDPARGHAVRKMEAGSAERVDRRVMVEYRADADATWVPAGWRSERLNPDGRPHLVSEVTVTRLEVNQPVVAGEFQLTFPPGTAVHEKGARQEYRVGADGEIRPLTAEEIFGPAPRTSVRQWVGRHAWTLVLIATGVVTVLFGYLYWRRSRIRIAPAPQGAG